MWIFDVWMSGIVYGMVVLYVVLEVVVGGLFVVVCNGDWIELDCEVGMLYFDILDEEL